MNGLPSPPADTSDSVGMPRPTNNIALKVNAAIASPDSVGLYWARQPVDSVRIWYGLAPVPVSQWNIQGAYSSHTMPGNDTALIVAGLTDSTLYYFGAQVEVKGLWSIVTAPATDSMRTLAAKTGAAPNNAAIDSITFDTTYNRLYVFWHDTDALHAAFTAGIAAWPYGTPMPPTGAVAITTPVKTPRGMVDTIPMNPPALDFDGKYTFGVYVLESARRHRRLASLISWSIFADPRMAGRYVFSSFGRHGIRVRRTDQVR